MLDQSFLVGKDHFSKKKRIISHLKTEIRDKGKNKGKEREKEGVTVITHFTEYILYDILL